MPIQKRASCRGRPGNNQIFLANMGPTAATVSNYVYMSTESFCPSSLNITLSFAYGIFHTTLKQFVAPHTTAALACAVQH